MLNYTLEEMIARTGLRRPSFQMMIDHLRTIENPLIIETGCIRPGDQPWSSIENSFKDDGMSTCIFDRYVTEYNGEFHSVDLTPAHVDYAQSMVSENSQIHCNDSVSFLWTASQQLAVDNQFVDLLYLDSYDYTEGNEAACMAHHIKEFAAIGSRLRPGSMIVVDDNYGTPDKRTGKGVYLIEFMSSIGIPLLHDGVQCVWKL
jgi:hypothetical protein